jgi:hypothetical protein
MAFHPKTIESFVEELQKIAGEQGYYVSFFTGEKRKDATFFPRGSMNLPAEEIVELAKNKEVAPQGPISAIRFLNYYHNRAGKQLKPERRAEIRKAVTMLSEYHKTEKAKK